MKNIKNTIAVMSLVAVLGLGSITANAGLLVSDRGIGDNTPNCETSSDGGIFNQLVGILIAGAVSSATGIIIVGRPGLLVSDRNSNSCQSNQNKGGLLVSD